MSRELLDAIISGKSVDIEAAFNKVAEDKMNAGIETFRQEVAAELFNESVEPEIEGLDSIIEAYETLDEISRKTLGSYIEKAAKDAATNSNIAGKSNDFKRDVHYSKLANKRLNGIAKAAKKLTKEDFEALQAYITEEEQIVEDILALDEISKKTLGSYIKKASIDAINKGMSSGIAAALNKPANASAKAFKRYKGIAKATDKLTKEQKELIGSILEELEAE